jgi:hypothetical protein
VKSVATCNVKDDNGVACGHELNSENGTSHLASHLRNAHDLNPPAAKPVTGAIVDAFRKAATPQHSQEERIAIAFAATNTALQQLTTRCFDPRSLKVFQLDSISVN